MFSMNIVPFNQMLYAFSFVWPENGSVAQSRRLRATDPFEGQTNLLLSEEPVYNSFIFSKFSFVLLVYFFRK